MRRAGEAVADAAAEMLPAGGCDPRPVRAGQQRRRRVCRRAASWPSERLRGRPSRCSATGSGSRATRRRRRATWTGRSRPIAGRSRRGRRWWSTPCSGPGWRASSTARRSRASGASTRAGRPVLAVDMPSGIDGDTGRGPRARRSGPTRTVTFARRKPGHLLLPGRAHCGPVEVADIGIRDGTICAGRQPADLRQRTRACGRRASRGPRSTPTSTGAATRSCCPAAPTQTGAARLTARGALRVGAGLVTVAAPADALAVNAAHLTAVMLRALRRADDLAALLADPRFNAVAARPGARGRAGDPRAGRGGARGAAAPRCSTPTR